MMVSFQGIGGTRNLRWDGFLVKSLQPWGTGSLVMALALPRFWGRGQILDLGLSFICPLLPISVSGGGCLSELLEKTASIRKIPEMVTFHFYLWQPFTPYDSNLMTQQGNFPFLYCP